MAEQQSILRNLLNKVKSATQPIGPAEQVNEEHQTGTVNEAVLPEANFPLGASDFKPDEYACFVPYDTNVVLLHIGLTETLENRLQCALTKDPYAPHMSEIDVFHFGILYNTANGTIKLICDCDSYEDGYETTFTADLPHFQDEEKYVIKCLDDFCKKEGYQSLSHFVNSEYPSNRIICDRYVKDVKETLSHNKESDFNRRILAVNNMYGWLYDQGILRDVSFQMKDYEDIAYFGFNTKTLEPYRSQMEASGIPDAALAVRHIFDEEYTPCRYSGAIELSWTMMTYRDVDGSVGRSWECELVRNLSTEAAMEVFSVFTEKGAKDAIDKGFTLSGFVPDLFDKAFEHYSNEDLEMKDNRDYLESHADKMIRCFQNHDYLCLLDIDCWVRFEELLGTKLSHEDYLTLSAYLDENLPDGIYDPHDIEEDDVNLIGLLKITLEKGRSLDDKAIFADVIGYNELDNQNTIYTIALEPGFFVDVKVNKDTALVYIMQNEDGSTVYSDDFDDNTFPDYEYDMEAVVGLIKKAFETFDKKDIKTALDDMMSGAAKKAGQPTGHGSRTGLDGPGGR